MQEREPWQQGFIIGEKDTETSEIPEGIFDIKQELKNVLKLPKTERRAALNTYKEKLAEFHRGMAKFQKELIEKVRSNPEISIDELTEELTKTGEQLGFNETVSGDETYEFTKRTLEDYIRKHTAVREARSKYQNDQELFKYLFNKEPVGQIKIIEGPMMLYICCEKIEDYAHAEGSSYLTQDEGNKEQTDSYKDSAGTFLGDSIHEDLAGCLCLENSSLRDFEDSPDKNTYTHEEQHAFYDMIWRNFHDDLSNEGEIVAAETLEEKRLAIQRKLRDIRELEADDSAKDEILAFMKEHYEHPQSTTEEVREAYKRYWSGYNKVSKIIELIKYFQGHHKDNRYGGKVYEHLTASEKDGGIYDYLADQIKLSTEELKSLMKPEDYPLIDEMVEKVFVKEYKQLLMTGIQSFITLKHNGYSVDEVIAILQSYSLRDWNKIPARVPYKSTESK